jgi:hypothetical protein
MTTKTISWHTWNRHSDQLLSHCCKYVIVRKPMGRVNFYEIYEVLKVENCGKDIIRGKLLGGASMLSQAKVDVDIIANQV